MNQYKDRQFKLIIKEDDPKLTVTSTRITVELPPSVVDTDKYTQWSKLVADQIPLDTPSLRGRFVEDSITLRKNNKEVYKTFKVVSVMNLFMKHIRLLMISQLVKLLQDTRE